MQLQAVGQGFWAVIYELIVSGFAFQLIHFLKDTAPFKETVWFTTGWSGRFLKGQAIFDIVDT